MSFKVNRLVSAAYIAFGAAVIGATYAPSVFAQSNATGTIYGQVPADATSVVLENLGNGSKRTLTPDSSRRVQATALQPGQYRAQLMNGSTVVSTTEVEVLLGQGVEVIFAGASLQKVQVTGSRSKIDVSSTNSSTTFTARQLEALPIAQNLTSIMLLAPDVVKADPRYAGGASIGGGAPSENSYYINGFPVTNPLSQLGSMELPFGAIQQAQILTGGFGAEFGRSTGGVVNVTTKSGTNEWKGGVSASWEPNSLRSSPKDIYYPSTGNPDNAATDGQLYRYRRDNTRTETNIGGYIGGPIIKDELFFFLAADQTINRTGEVSSTAGQVTSSTLPNNGWEDNRNKNQRYLAKIDWNITDAHRLEYTGIGDNYYTSQATSGFDYATLSRTGVGPRSYSGDFKNVGNLTTGVGGTANIIKYTGSLTSDLTLTALYGQSDSPHRELYSPDYSGGIPGSVFSTASGRNPGIDYGVANPLSGQNLSAPYGKDSTKSYRLDIEYQLGSHLIRAGLDSNKLKSEDAGDNVAGGSTYSYRFTASPLTPRAFGGTTYVVADGSPLGNAGYFVRQRTFSSVTDARSDQSAQYIEDRYQVTKNLLLTLGLRNESFKGYNGEGKEYLKSDNFLSPRFGASWDVKGDSSLKVFGNLGRYSIQTPTHVAVRGAGVSTLVDQFFTYTGVDANGVPTGLRPLTAVVSPDGETGQPKDPNAVAAQNLKPTFQDELILGMEKALSADLTVGVKGTYRKLRETLDDFCDFRPFQAYADRNGIDRTYFDSQLDSFSCKSINLNHTNKFLVNYQPGVYTEVNLSPQADMGFDKPKRTYFALDFFAEHPFSNGWYGRVAYTWSKNKGNTEGQTKSDIGQTDVAATQTWDHKELMYGAEGYLPSDRRHQFKAIGIYQFHPEWAVGANAFVSSGRPKNCSGNYAGPVDPADDSGVAGSYGATYFYCDGVLAPRGSLGRLPWDYSLDMNVSYQPVAIKGFKFRVDVFNLFNRQSALAISEQKEPDFDSTTTLPTYQRVLNYTAPRYVRFTAQYDF